MTVIEPASGVCEWTGADHLWEERLIGGNRNPAMSFRVCLACGRRERL